MEDLDYLEVESGAFRKKVGLYLGPTLFLICIFLPFSFPSLEAKRLFGVFIWVVVWWVCEVIPLPVTAIMGSTLCAILRIGDLKEIFSPYADPIIFLFLGSFFIAKGISVNKVDEIIARNIVSNKFFSKTPFMLFISLSASCSFLSMWLSNSAVTAIFYPIALAILKSFPKQERNRLAPSLLLIVAYSASLGGIGTIVGTPPNLIGIAMLNKFCNVKVSFLEWMIFAVPLYITGLIIFLFYLKISIKMPKSINFEIEIKKGEKLHKDQYKSLLIFAIVVLLWIIPGILSFLIKDEGIKKNIFSILNESTVALIGATLFFLINQSDEPKRKLLEWNDAKSIDWGTLILFGGGMSLGSMVFKTGLAKFFGENFLKIFGKPPEWLFILLSIVIAVMLTESVSNTASANIIIPIIISISKVLNFSPLLAVLGSTIACSLAFMLPVSTPPNAIVYGSKIIPITEMVKKGFILDLIMIVLTFFFVFGFKG